jgi:transcriptional repressor NrdR
MEKQLREIGITEVPTTEIGEMVLERLVNIDEVAYVRFASVYRQFQDIDLFIRELEDLRKRSQATDIKHFVAENDEERT